MMKHHLLQGLMAFLLLSWFCGCHYPQPALSDETLSSRSRDSLDCLASRHYTFDTNLLLVDDSLQLACLPVKDCYVMLYRGDRVVVAEVAVQPADSIDSLWVKVAKDEQVQGWISESCMKQAFVPTDSISQAIYFFSRTHAVYFIAICALFVVVWLYRALSKRQLMLVYFNDIDSFYPLLLCLLMAVSATLYASMQLFVPETWEHFYYNPTLSPLHVPPILSLFLSALWLFVVVLLAAIDESFRQLSPSAACCYLLGLAACCICCYLFFIITTAWMVGYLCLLLMAWLCYRKARASWRASRYRCGKCGHRMARRGICPHCGTLNE